MEPKLKDKMLLTSNNYSSQCYYHGVVTHVTKTRFEVTYGERVQTFTKDGRQYPRPTGYNGGMEAEPLTDEGIALLEKQRKVNKASTLANKLDDIFSNGNYRTKMYSMRLTDAELDETLEALQVAYDKLKKYGPKEEQSK